MHSLTGTNVPLPTPHPEAPRPDGEPPPPPSLLVEFLKNLRSKFPNDIFEETMQLEWTAGSDPCGATWRYIPYIKCLDCSDAVNKLYPAEAGNHHNFRSHLRTFAHQERVAKRMRGSATKD
ncbi:hypothetical protein BDZ45DRAFT_748343 [Acephala macrosclerotiorum]|nr:hypothetical protein BDZ45DRAFT_748343 [Acephala macrosclerotiorum]